MFLLLSSYHGFSQYNYHAATDYLTTKNDMFLRIKYSKKHISFVD